jgi:hypothetical protein
VFYLVGGLVPGSSGGNGYSYCSSYEAANPFSSLNPFSSSFIGDPGSNIFLKKKAVLVLYVNINESLFKKKYH